MLDLSDTPAGAIARLDAAIARRGQTIQLRRGAAGPVREGPGFVRGYDVEKVVGLITLADRKVIISPTDFGSDLPRASDDFASIGKLGKVQEVEPIYLAGTLVRIEMRVRLG